MVLPASGAISMSQIRDEFGGTNPVTLTQYYRSSTLGAPVPDNAVNGNIPTGGQISMQQFRNGLGLYGIGTRTITGQFTSWPNASEAGFTFNTDGTLIGRVVGNVTLSPPWLRVVNGNASSQFQVQVNAVSGTFNGLNSGTGTWLNLGDFSRSWSITVTPSQFGGTVSRSLTCDVAVRNASTQQIITNHRVTLFCQASGFG